MQNIQIEILQLRKAVECDLPRYQSDGASGMDLRACIDLPITVQPGRVTSVPCGIAIAVPPGFEAQIRPRSGLALRQQVTVLNAPGTVDSDYRGEITVILANFGDAPFEITPGLRIAQIVIAPVARAVWQTTNSLPPTSRSDSGFGSTGTE
jgi:dUTP pyrophosphatase